MLAGVRVGVVGTGTMGAHHVRTLGTAVSGATVVGVCDVDRERAVEAARGLDVARLHDSPAALVDAPEVDAVLVASPDHTHEAVVLACLRAGKPALCEKPLAPTVAECLRVVRAEAALGRRLVSVAFMRRHDPAYRAVKRALNADEIGAPLLLHCVHRNAVARGGATEQLLTGSAIHEIDVLRWLTGAEITRVTVHRPRRSRLAAGTLQDPLLVVLETATGVLADVEVFVNARYGYDVRCELVGERGTLTLGQGDGTRLRRDRHDSAPVSADFRDRFADAYRAQLQDWVAGLARGQATGASAWDGYCATAVAGAGVAALDSGRPCPVRLEARPALYGGAA